MLAATGVGVDDSFFLVAWLYPLRGPGLVPSSADGRCHGSERGGHFPPFVQGPVASNVGLRDVLLQSQGKRKLSQSGIPNVKYNAHSGGIRSTQLSVLNSKEYHGME